MVTTVLPVISTFVARMIPSSVLWPVPSRYMYQLFEAYQFKADEAVFEQRFKRFVVANNSRKALLNRLKSLLL